MSVLIKVHEVYRKIVAVCDKELLGKRFEEGKLQLEINERFYGGEELSEEKAIKLLRKAFQDDACFNFVGKNSVELGIKAGIIDSKCIIKIQGVPHALALL
ncbi:MAG: DUF424 family protein [Candidatus Pacearchaeota archaeon]